MNTIPLVPAFAERIVRDISEFLQPDSCMGIWEGLGGIGCTLAEISTAIGSSHLRSVALQLDELLAMDTSGAKATLGLSGSPFVLLLVREQVHRTLGLPFSFEADYLLDRSYDTSTTQTDFFTGLSGDLCAIIWLDRRGLLSRNAAIGPVAEIADKLMATVRECNEVLIYENGGSGGCSDGPYHGLAHGGAGVAVALAEAGVFLNDKFLRSAAYALIQSELDTMDPSGFWRDTRILPLGKAKEPYYVGECWCNGTVGIIQALDHLSTILKDPALRRKSGQVKARARQTVRQYQGAPNDLCLCHGFTNALLLEGSDFSWLDHAHSKVFERVVEQPGLANYFLSTTRIKGNCRLATLSHYLGLSGVLQQLHRNLRQLPQNAFSMPMEIPV